jgi:signal transduction histidine kinase
MESSFAHIKNMDINRVTLRFTNQGREQEFQDYYYENSHIASRVSFLLTAILYSLFGYLDYITTTEYLDAFWTIRYFIVLPILLAVYISTFIRKLKNYWQPLMFFSYLVAATGISIMIVVLPEDFIYSNGLLLIFFAGYVFIKLRFFWASVAGWISLIIYNLLALNFGNIELTALIINNFFFVGANMIGMFAAYNAEVFDRRNFFLLEQVEAKNKDIAEINKGLERKVEKRTALLNRRNEELHEEIARRIVIEQELVLAKEKAEQSDKLKSAFLANMSHEIRTPMNGIIGFANLLREAENEEELNEFIEIIIKNGDHLLNLINDIIDLSKIEAGILKVNKYPFNLNELTNELYKTFLMNPNVQERNLSIKMVNGLSDEQSTIITDRTRLNQILINIINNACKYTDRGSIEIGYSIKGDQLHFYVKDTGIGISEEQQEHLFERFMQVTLNNTPKREGTGLGLAITKTYLKMMGGNIQVRSTPNVGSTFSFYLPIEFVKEDENGI